MVSVYLCLLLIVRITATWRLAQSAAISGKVIVCFVINTRWRKNTLSMSKMTANISQGSVASSDVLRLMMCCSLEFLLEIYFYLGLLLFFVGRPYYRSSLWYSVSSVCRLSVCLSVTFCIVAKRCVLAKKCLKE